MKVSPQERLPLLKLCGLTFAALAIHGYHLGVEDGEIYLPAARWFRDPNLYPFAREFFLSHGNRSIFGPVMAASSFISHMSMDWTFFVWYLICIFATLASCWLLAAVCFTSERARWCAVLVMTAVLSMPATNTGLLLVDPYLTARSFSTPLTLFVLASVLERRFVRAGVAMVLTAAVHPQMVVYLLFIIGIVFLKELRQNKLHEPVPVLTGAFLLAPLDFRFSPATGPYREALFSRDYFFLYNWTWYHWLGLLAPLAFLVWFWKADLRGTRPAFRKVSFALVVVGAVSILVAILFSLSPYFDMFVRLQPLRTFHLITMVFVLFIAGLVGEYAGRSRAWVAAAIAIPLAIGMYFVERQTFPNSPHIEFPSLASSNPWVKTLLWVRQNTPVDAVFAVDSRYFVESPVDKHGFRAISERSALADYHKDGGVVCLFPALATEWKQMSNATYGLNHFTLDQFHQLKQEYPMVSWVVIHGAAPPGMNCPYQQDLYSVCRMP